MKIKYICAGSAILAVVIMLVVFGVGIMNSSASYIPAGVVNVTNATGVLPNASIPFSALDRSKALVQIEAQYNGSTKYTPTNDNELILVSAQNDTVNISLPAPETAEGVEYKIRKTDGSQNVMQIYSSQTIEGLRYINTSSNNVTYVVLSDGKVWNLSFWNSSRVGNTTEPSLPTPTVVYLGTGTGLNNPGNAIDYNTDTYTGIGTYTGDGTVNQGIALKFDFGKAVQRTLRIKTGFYVSPGQTTNSGFLTFQQSPNGTGWEIIGQPVVNSNPETIEVVETNYVNLTNRYLKIDLYHGTNTVVMWLKIYEVYWQAI